MENITINLDEIRSIGFTAIRRAYAFMGFGINAAENPEHDRIILPGIGRPQILPEEISAENLDAIKNEFKIWVTGGALRELVEGFEGYLRAVLHTLIKAHVSKGVSLDAGKLITNFEHVGIGEKLELINKEFDLKIPSVVDFVAVTHARNCLTHGHGIIRDRDCNEKQEKALILKWRTIDIRINSNDGKQISLKTDNDDPIEVKAGGQAIIQATDKIKKFDLGSRLELTPKEFEDLCFACQLFVSELHGNLITVFQNIDIAINVKENGTTTNSSKSAPQSPARR